MGQLVPAEGLIAKQQCRATKPFRTLLDSVEKNAAPGPAAGKLEHDEQVDRQHRPVLRGLAALICGETEQYFVGGGEAKNTALAANRPCVGQPLLERDVGRRHAHDRITRLKAVGAYVNYGIFRHRRPICEAVERPCP